MSPWSGVGEIQSVHKFLSWFSFLSINTSPINTTTIMHFSNLAMAAALLATTIGSVVAQDIAYSVRPLEG
jgi:hypothetical protein